VKTLHRTVQAHAWLQDEILLPALKGKPLVGKILLDEISQEHKDLDRFIANILKIAPEQKDEIEAHTLQIRTLLQTHFQKEAGALYPLTEKVVDASTLTRLREEMARRETEVRDVITH